MKVPTKPLPLLYCFLALQAHASVFTETTGEVSVSGLDLSEGDLPPEIYLPVFNPALGTLQSMSLVFTEGVTSVVTNYTGTPQNPEQVPATVSTELFGPESFSVTPANLTVTSNGVFADVDTTFDQTFVATTPAIFEEYNYFDVEPDVFVQSLAGPDTEDMTGISYDITENFTYQPVPEPGSTSLFALGALAVALVTRKRSV